MRLGLLTDIHEHIVNLQRALAEFDRLGVDRVLCIGDVVATGARLPETVTLLAERKIAGVWGNHDFGLCGHPSTLVSSRRARFVGPVLDYLATFQPFLEIEDCFLSHVEPWRDLNNVTGLWYLEGPPDTPEKAARSLDACEKRVLFTGHLHRWLLATRAGLLPWDGATPIWLESPERFLVVVGALCDGFAATYDTQSYELVPIDVR